MILKLPSATGVELLVKMAIKNTIQSKQKYKPDTFIAANIQNEQTEKRTLNLSCSK